MAQLVASMSGVVLGGVVEVVGSILARGKIFTASIGSVSSLYPSVYIYIYIYIYIYNIYIYIYIYCVYVRCRRLVCKNIIVFLYLIKVTILNRFN